MGDRDDILRDGCCGRDGGIEDGSNARVSRRAGRGAVEYKESVDPSRIWKRNVRHDRGGANK